MKSLPRLPRQLIRPKESFEKQLWRPHWNCYCCSDTGLVLQNLAQLVIPEYKLGVDAYIVCRSPNCSAGDGFKGDLNYDQRFTSVICAELDRLYRLDWNLTVRSQAELIRSNTIEIAEQKNIRKRDRTHLEQQYAESKHQEAITDALDENLVEPPEN